MVSTLAHFPDRHHEWTQITYEKCAFKWGRERQGLREGSFFQRLWLYGPRGEWKGSQSRGEK